MNSAYLICTVLGTSSIGLWLYVRFPGRRPRGVRGALTHVLFSFVAVKLGQSGVRSTLSAFPEPYAVMVALVMITVPVLSYLFVSWIWLLTRLRSIGGLPPRGGHPVRAASRA